MRALRTFLSLFALTCLARLASATPPLTTFTTKFYADVEGVQTQVGSGTLSIAGSYPTDGIYDYDPFNDFHLTLTFDGGHVFTEDNFHFDPAPSQLVITGTEFQFTGGANDEMGGSVDFLNGQSDYISFSNWDDPDGYTYLLAADYSDPDNYTPVFEGRYGPIPEPATYATIAGATLLAYALLRRRRLVA